MPGAVHPTALRTDNSVLKSILHPNAIATSNIVGPLHRLQRRDGFSIDGHATPRLDTDGDRFDSIRCVLRPDPHDGVDDATWRVQFFEIFSLMGQSGQIRVGAIALLRAGICLNPLLSEVGDHFCAAWKLLEQAEVAPRCIDLHLRRQNVGVPLEAYLVIATPGRTVGQHRAPTLLHRADETRYRDRSRDPRRIPVAAVVGRERLEDEKTGLCHLVFEVHDGCFCTVVFILTMMSLMSSSSG